MAEVTIDTTKIIDWASFHRVFKEALGFPDFYGNNMDAWIDCLTDLNREDHYGLSNIMLVGDEMLHLHITHTKDFNTRQPEIMAALIECAAFVNYRSLYAEEKPKLSLVFLDSRP